VTETSCPLPAATVLQAKPGWQAIDFISDLHLAAAQPATFDAWQAFMRGTTADAVFILGDLFEFWHGDDAGAMPFEARCLEVLRACSSRRFVGVMVGNRDFLLSARLLGGCGVELLNDPTLLEAWEQRLLLTHGDALCLDDVAYQKFRQWARSAEVRQDFLARPLAERVLVAAGFRHASEAGRQQALPTGVGADLDAAAAVACLRDADATHMVHGHTHRPGDSGFASGFARSVLSDWDLDGGAHRAEVLRLTPDGLSRLDPQADL
jgi:UDP-2,3-diacylglucosamine hydrolase